MSSILKRYCPRIFIDLDHVVDKKKEDKKNFFFRVWRLYASIFVEMALTSRNVNYFVAENQKKKKYESETRIDPQIDYHDSIFFGLKLSDFLQEISFTNVFLLNMIHKMDPRSKRADVELYKRLYYYELFLFSFNM